jgi:hypothetical protein
LGYLICKRSASQFSYIARAEYTLGLRLNAAVLVVDVEANKLGWECSASTTLSLTDNHLGRF